VLPASAGTASSPKLLRLLHQLAHCAAGYIQKRRFTVIVSSITMLELLVLPENAWLRSISTHSLWLLAALLTWAAQSHAAAGRKCFM
jgi:hypothetical protein